MTDNEILNYLFLTNIKPGTGKQITRLVMKNKEGYPEEDSIVFFSKSNQKMELINHNKWVFQHIDRPYDCFVVDGKDVLFLQVETRPSF